MDKKKYKKKKKKGESIVKILRIVTPENRALLCDATILARKIILGPRNWYFGEKSRNSFS